MQRQVAFAHEHRSQAVLAVEAAVTALFAVDMVLTLRTAYEVLDANSILVCVTVPAMIAKRYLRTWFLGQYCHTCCDHLDSLLHRYE
jgi:hypothetical protein